jgi:hypothetical protein
MADSRLGVFLVGFARRVAFGLPLVFSNFEKGRSFMKHTGLAAASKAVVEELEGRQLLSASVGAAAAAHSAILNGNYSGTLHVGHLAAGFFGATAAANPHSIPASLSVTQGVNGLVTGTLAVGATANTSAQTYTVQGVARGRKFDAVFWQGSSLASSTASGQIKGSLDGAGTLVHGSLSERVGGHVSKATFKFSPSLSLTQVLSNSSPFVPDTTSASLVDYVGVAHLHVPHALKGTTLSGQTAKLASGKEGFSLNVTQQSANGSVGGTLLVQNLGTFDFVGSRTGSKETLVINGANGSGTASVHMGGNVSISGSLSDLLNGQVLSGSFHARNTLIANSSSASAGNSNSSGNGQVNASTPSPFGTSGLGLGGTPTNTTAGASLGTTSATGSSAANNTNTATTNGSVTNTSTGGVGLGIGGTPTATGSTTSTTGGSANGDVTNFPPAVGSPGSAGGAIGTPGSGTTLVGSPGSAGSAIGAPGSGTTLVGSPGSAGGAAGTPGSASDLVGSVSTTGTGSTGSMTITSGATNSDAFLSGASSGFTGI